MRTSLLGTLLLSLLAVSSIVAQTPAPIILQAATPAPAGLKPAVPTSPAADDAKSLMQLLQAMQATNVETIKKQEAALETLDGMQKAAEEMKIFSKRG